MDTRKTFGSPLGKAPELLGVDGMVLAPNFETCRFEAFDITGETHRSRFLWSFGVSQAPCYPMTPAYHGLAFYYTCENKILSVSALDGSLRKENFDQLPDSIIQPAPNSSQLIFEHGLGRDKEVYLFLGLKEHVVLCNLRNRSTTIIRLDNNLGYPNSAVYTHDRVLMTTSKGCFFELNLENGKTRELISRGLLMSAPVVVRNRVYCEAINYTSGQRWVVEYRPGEEGLKTTPLPKSANLMPDPVGITENLSAPLTNGHQLFFSDRHGKYAFIFQEGSIETYHLATEDRGFFIPNQSVFFKTHLYSISRMGLTVFDLKTWNSRKLSLSGGSTISPVPVSSPIIYDNRIFILCEDRLVCKSLI